MEVPPRLALSAGNGGGGNRTRVRSRDESRDKATFVYFVQAGGRAGPIKIGIAGNLNERLRMLQCGNHRELTIVTATRFSNELARRIEQLLHSRLTHHRIAGEWFKAHRDVLDASRNPEGFVAASLEAQDRNARFFAEADA